MIWLMLFVVMIVFFILPQMRRQKKERNFVNALKKGDRVIMKSGMHGKISELNDQENFCIIETGAGKIKFDRSAISSELTMRLNKPSTKK